MKNEEMEDALEYVLRENDKLKEYNAALLAAQTNKFLSIKSTKKTNIMSNLSIMPVTEVMSIGKAFAESGMFPDTKTAAQAIVKIQAGQEIGIPPFAAMTGIHIILGKPTIGAGIIASKIKSSGKYDYKVVQQDDKICSLDFFEGKMKVGNSTFTIEDARKAQTKNIDKFPKNMLFARAVSNGVKWFCPDVFFGPVYTPEELPDEKQLPQVTQEVEAVYEKQTNGVPSFTLNTSDL